MSLWFFTIFFLFNGTIFCSSVLSSLESEKVEPGSSFGSDKQANLRIKTDAAMAAAAYAVENEARLKNLELDEGMRETKNETSEKP